MSNHQHRKYMLVIQNPDERGFTHEVIRDTLACMNIHYFCMSDEVATTGTKHTHVFLYRKGAIRESTIRRNFPNVHFQACTGSCQQNREYIAKEGKWSNNPKADTSIPGTFEEYGEMPDERQENNPDMSELIKSIEEGYTTAEIIRKNPKFVFRTNDINTLRQTILAEKYMQEQRDVTVYYLFGPADIGKRKTIFETHNAADIYRVTQYGTASSGVRHDGYHAQAVIVFENFASQIQLPNMMNYLEGYPLYMPARYSDRVACYTTVYITSTKDLSEQYAYERVHNPTLWNAFIRRMSGIIEFLPDGAVVEHKKEEYL